MNDPMLEYRIRQEIDYLLDSRLIEEIRNLVTTAKPQMSNTQFSLLQNVTRDTDSVRVMLTWLRYQVSRYPAWQQNRFGDQLIEYLSNLQQDAGDVLNQAGVDANTPHYRRQVNHVWRLLIRQYVGHLRRVIVAEGGK